MAQELPKLSTGCYSESALVHCRRSSAESFRLDILSDVVLQSKILVVLFDEYSRACAELSAQLTWPFKTEPKFSPSPSY